MGTGFGWVLYLPARICLRPHKGLLKTAALTLLPAFNYPMVCQVRAPKTAHCLEMREPVQKHQKMSSWRHLHGWEREGKEAKVCHLFTTWNTPKCFLTHIDLLISIYGARNWIYRPGGNNVKIYTTTPWSQIFLECTATDSKRREARHRRESVKWRARAKGKACSLLVVPLILSLKFSIVRAVCPEQFSPIDTASIQVHSSHKAAWYINMNQVQIQLLKLKKIKQ